MFRRSLSKLPGDKEALVGLPLRMLVVVVALLIIIPVTLGTYNSLSKRQIENQTENNLTEIATKARQVYNQGDMAKKIHSIHLRENLATGVEYARFGDSIDGPEVHTIYFKMRGDEQPNSIVLQDPNIPITGPDNEPFELGPGFHEIEIVGVHPIDGNPFVVIKRPEQDISIPNFPDITFPQNFPDLSAPREGEILRESQLDTDGEPDSPPHHWDFTFPITNKGDELTGEYNVTITLETDVGFETLLNTTEENEEPFKNLNPEETYFYDYPEEVYMDYGDKIHIHLDPMNEIQEYNKYNNNRSFEYQDLPRVTTEAVTAENYADEVVAEYVNESLHHNLRKEEYYLVDDIEDADTIIPVGGPEVNDYTEDLNHMTKSLESNRWGYYSEDREIIINGEWGWEWFVGDESHSGIFGMVEIDEDGNISSNDGETHWDDVWIGEESNYEKEIYLRKRFIPLYGIALDGTINAAKEFNETLSREDMSLRKQVSPRIYEDEALGKWFEDSNVAREKIKEIKGTGTVDKDGRNTISEIIDYTIETNFYDFSPAEEQLITTMYTSICQDIEDPQERIEEFYRYLGILSGVNINEKNITDIEVQSTTGEMIENLEQDKTSVQSEEFKTRFDPEIEKDVNDFLSELIDYTGKIIEIALEIESIDGTEVTITDTGLDTATDHNLEIAGLNLEIGGEGVEAGGINFVSAGAIGIVALIDAMGMVSSYVEITEDSEAFGWDDAFEVTKFINDLTNLIKHVSQLLMEIVDSVREWVKNAIHRIGEKVTRAVATAVAALTAVVAAVSLVLSIVSLWEAWMENADTMIIAINALSVIAGFFGLIAGIAGILTKIMTGAAAAAATGVGIVATVIGVIIGVIAAIIGGVYLYLKAGEVRREINKGMTSIGSNLMELYHNLENRNISQLEDTKREHEHTSQMAGYIAEEAPSGSLLESNMQYFEEREEALAENYSNQIDLIGEGKEAIMDTLEKMFYYEGDDDNTARGHLFGLKGVEFESNGFEMGVPLREIEEGRSVVYDEDLEEVAIHTYEDTKELNEEQIEWLTGENPTGWIGSDWEDWSDEEKDEWIYETWTEHAQVHYEDKYEVPADNDGGNIFHPKLSDLNNNGYNDIVYSTTDENINIMWNRRLGFDSSEILKIDVPGISLYNNPPYLIEDLDRDGIEDIVVVNKEQCKLITFYNTGRREFTKFGQSLDYEPDGIYQIEDNLEGDILITERLSNGDLKLHGYSWDNGKFSSEFTRVHPLELVNTRYDLAFENVIDQDAGYPDIIVTPEDSRSLHIIYGPNMINRKTYEWENWNPINTKSADMNLDGRNNLIILGRNEDYEYHILVYEIDQSESINIKSKEDISATPPYPTMIIDRVIGDYPDILYNHFPDDSESFRPVIGLLEGKGNFDFTRKQNIAEDEGIEGVHEINYGKLNAHPDRGEENVILVSSEDRGDLSTYYPSVLKNGKREIRGYFERANLGDQILFRCEKEEELYSGEVPDWLRKNFLENGYYLSEDSRLVKARTGVFIVEREIVPGYWLPTGYRIEEERRGDRVEIYAESDERGLELYSQDDDDLVNYIEQHAEFQYGEENNIMTSYQYKYVLDSDITEWGWTIRESAVPEDWAEAVTEEAEDVSDVMDKLSEVRTNIDNLHSSSVKITTEPKEESNIDAEESIKVDVKNTGYLPMREVTLGMDIISLDKNVGYSDEDDSSWVPEGLMEATKTPVEAYGIGYGGLDFENQDVIINPGETNSFSTTYTFDESELLEEEEYEPGVYYYVVGIYMGGYPGQEDVSQLEYMTFPLFLSEEEDDNFELDLQLTHTQLSHEDEFESPYQAPHKSSAQIRDIDTISQNDFMEDLESNYNELEKDMINFKPVERKGINRRFYTNEIIMRKTTRRNRNIMKQLT